MTTESLLNDFLLNFENCSNVEEKTKDPNIIWRTLLLCPSIWENITACPFNADTFRQFLQQLDAEERKKYLFLGIECLTHFVQANFCGPQFPDDLQNFFESISCKCCYIDDLTTNNERINVNTKYPFLLAVAICIFKYGHVHSLLNSWWQMRALIVHQQVMDELCPTLLAQFELLQKEIKPTSLKGHIRARFEVEQAQLYMLFRNVQKVEEHLETASNQLGLKYYLTGKLGKRMKHQQRDIAQLALEVSMVDVNDLERPPVNNFQVPVDVCLDNERLDAVKFVVEPLELKVFPNLEQILLLKIAQSILISKPQDDLRYEEIQPFIDLILRQKNTWTVRATTLLFRCHVEANHKRTVERSLMQCEEVYNSVNKEEPHVLNRVGAIYATGLQPVWQTGAQLARLMLNLGMVKASLDLFTKLQQWEEVIVCYTLLKMKHKAAEVIKQELEKSPSPKLLCLLGDATDDVTCYEKAWDLSKRRSSRVQRHWGNYFYGKKQYKECIPHFERSVSINPMQVNVWLRLGYAALETENWQVSATAYRRYTTLEPENFEAWNNLAKAYIKLGNKRSAHQALQDALSCNFENWKVWDNLMVVSVDMGRYADVIRAYNRILDLREKHLDLEVLSSLIYGVSQNTEENQGLSAANLLQKTRELLGRLTSIYPTEGQLWELYAALVSNFVLKSQRLQKAFKSYISHQNWIDDPVDYKKVLNVCHQLADIALSDEVEASNPLVNSVRLIISSTIATMKRSGAEEHNLLKYLARLIQKAKLAIIKNTNAE